MLHIFHCPHEYHRVGKRKAAFSIKNFSAFTGFVAVYVSASICDPKKYPQGCPPDVKLVATQTVACALYGVLICLLICIALNWLMDMENQFKLMLIIQIVLTIPCGFLMWWIVGFEIVYVCAM